MKTTLTRLDPEDYIGPAPAVDQSTELAETGLVETEPVETETLDAGSAETDSAPAELDESLAEQDAEPVEPNAEPTSELAEELAAEAAPASRVRYVGPKVKLEISVDEETFAAEIDAAFRKISQQVRVPGFRPGRTPRKVLEAQIGAQAGRSQALEDSIPRMYALALRENDVEAVGQPEIEVTSGLESGAVAFEAVVEVRPVVKIDGYDKLQIKLPSPIPPPAEIDERVDDILRQHAELVEVDRAAQAGDRVTIDIQGSVDGQTLPGLSAQEYVYEVGSGGIAPEVDEQLTDTTVNTALKFSAPHPVHESAVIDFEIQLHKVCEAVLPELTDDWVDENTEYESVAAMRSTISDQLGFNRKLQANMAMRSEAERQLADLVPAPVPDAMIGAAVTGRIQELASQLQQRQMEFEQWLQTTGQSPDDFMQQLRDEAETGVKLNLALTAMALAEGLEPTADEIQSEYERLAEANNTDAESLMSVDGQGPAPAAVRSWLAHNKAMERVLEMSELVDEDGNPIDRSDLELKPPESASSPSADEQATDIDGAAADSDTAADSPAETATANPTEQQENSE